VNTKTKSTSPHFKYTLTMHDVIFSSSELNYGLWPVTLHWFCNEEMEQDCIGQILIEQKKYIVPRHFSNTYYSFGYDRLNVNMPDMLLRCA
jgi:hypothetical protein